MSDFINAERGRVKFFDGLEVDGYCKLDGEFRVSITGASILVGYSKEWLGRVLRKGGNTVKALRELGFTGQIEKLATRSIRGGGSSAETISLKDFQRIMLYAVQEKKPQAIALQMGLTEMSLTDFFRDAFGMRPLSIDEKRDRLYKAFAETLTAQDWINWDREDFEAIEEHLVFLEAR